MIKLFLKITDFFFKPFYCCFFFFPFNLKIGKYPVFKQFQYVHFNLTRKFRLKSTLVSITPKRNNKFLLEIISGKDFHNMFLYMAGVYEKNLTNCILKEIENHTVFIDVGAYIGYYSIMINCVFPKIDVHAIEPQEEAFAILEKNLYINNCKKVKTYNIALGNTNETNILNINRQNEQTSLLPISNNINAQQNVSIKKADDVFNIMNEKILIKIDTEGYEFEVINGMIALLNNNDCTVFFEFNPQIYNQFFGENYCNIHLATLVEKGFKLFVVNTKEHSEEFVYNPQELEQKILMVKKII